MTMHSHTRSMWTVRTSTTHTSSPSSSPDDRPFIDPTLCVLIQSASVRTHHLSHPQCTHSCAHVRHRSQHACLGRHLGIHPPRLTTPVLTTGYVAVAASHYVNYVSLMRRRQAQPRCSLLQTVLNWLQGPVKGCCYI